MMYSNARISVFLGALLTSFAASHTLGFNSKRDDYNYYHLWDFRSLVEYAGVPEIPSTLDAAAKAGPASDYFASDEWSWKTQTWASSSGPVKMQYSASNVYIEAASDNSTTADSWLTLRTTRLEDFQSTAEIDSVVTDYEYPISLYMYARTVGAAGACTAMFTYQSDQQEADVEILTSGPSTVVQFTDQPHTTQNTTLPDGLVWTDWQSYRYDWTAEKSTWYVNGVEVASIETDVPDQPSAIIFNAWSNGGSWTGEMEVGEAAYLQIQYVELYSNNDALA